MQIRVALVCATLWLSCLYPGAVLAQGAGSRSAAAEAYDRGTAAYLDGSYEKAAQWFETAHRMAPAAPALMQAVRAHHKGGNALKAASLALQLKLEYASEPAAVQFADSILEDNAAQYVQVQVNCTECTLEVDGGVQEYPVFFVEPDAAHTITAAFSTGSVSQEVNAAAGETREVAFEAPEAPPPEVVDPEVPPEQRPQPDNEPERSGMTPVVFFVGAGVTVGFAIGAIVTGLGAKSAVDDYNTKADEYKACRAEEPVCAEQDEIYADANKLLEDSQGKVTVRNVMYAMTGAFAVATATIGIFFTDWKGESRGESNAGLDVDVAPLRGGALATLKGSF